MVSIQATSVFTQKITDVPSAYDTDNDGLIEYFLEGFNLLGIRENFGK